MNLKELLKLTPGEVILYSGIASAEAYEVLRGNHSPSQALQIASEVIGIFYICVRLKKYEISYYESLEKSVDNLSLNNSLEHSQR